MKNIATYLILLLFFASCSLKTAPNEWQYKSSNAFDSYTKNFLSSNDYVAKIELSRAVENAKKGGDINTVAKIYLGECALKISVGEERSCEKFALIESIITDDSLHAYFELITANVSKEHVSALPEIYRDFALHINGSEFAKANADILKMDRVTSMFLSSTLIKENIEDSTIEKIIESASYNGYKKVVLFWLKEKIGRTKDKSEREKLKKRVFVLESNN